MSRQALGRGLASLIPAAPTQAKTQEGQETNQNDLYWLPVEQLFPNAQQPRKHFNDQAIESLAQSIKQQGVMQPIVARRISKAGFEIIAGERRWRAAQKARLQTVPVTLRDVDNKQSLEMALVENLQREELNPVEEAHAFSRLIVEFGHTQEDVAKMVGRDRATVSNIIRLLKLPDQIQEDVQLGQLTMGHARALLALDSASQQLGMRNKVVKQQLSVRQTEQLIKQQQSTAPGKPQVPVNRWKHLERDLESSLSVKVSIQSNAKGKGRISIDFANAGELDRLYQQLNA